MKRIQLALLAAAITLTAAADTGFTMYTFGANTTCWAIGLSPDGRYMSCWCGSGLGSAMFDTKTGQSYYCSGNSEFCAVTNEGMMIGYGEDNLFAYNPLTREQLASSSAEMLGKGVTTDGSIIVGANIVNGWSLKASYYKDGEVRLLPQPTEEMMGFDPGQGTVALDISDDGSLICGYLIDWFAREGILLWHLNAEGEYEIDPVCKDWHEAEFSGDAAYYLDSPTAMSHNGKYIAMNYIDNDLAYGGTPYVARYNLETGEMEKSSLNTSCSATRIADDGTMLVHTGDADSQSRRAMIWLPGEENPVYMKDLYPDVPEFALYDADNWNYGTCISADGKRICGMAWHYIEGDGEDYARQISWVFDRDEYVTTGIHEASPVTVFDSATAEYFSLDGKKLDAPQKGLNIVRQGDKVSKVIVR